MKLADFYFDLPDGHIARYPAEKRDESKLMVVDRQSGEISHHLFKDLPGLLGAGDFLVINNSRVIPVRLFGKIGDKGVELLITRGIDHTTAEALTMPARKFKIGARVILAKNLFAEVLEIGQRGKRLLKFNKELDQVLKSGYAPLPPYIKRNFDEAERYKELDLDRYQTVYACHAGSIAAPTAGLHFTPGLLEKIREKLPVLEITLDVGEATFQKIDTEDLASHRMGREYITIDRETGRKLAEFKKNKNLVAVGTTTVRALETYASKPPAGETFYSEIFIFPGFRFRLVDRLITNFHLPGSSLFILVSAFAGLELMQAAYRLAIEKNYRFFSYGDAMFIK